MITDIAITTALLVVLSVPLAISGWAFLDIASRPRWVWAFSGRRQVVWMAIVAFGVLTVVGGLLISGYYLLRIRPGLARIESGDVGE